MKKLAVKADLLYDGTGAKGKRNVYITFDKRIRSISDRKGDAEVVAEGVVTPAFIDAHCHIGMSRSGEPSREDESNEEMNALYPLVDALHSVYMDDKAFKESVEFGVLYSHVMPGSGNIVGGKTVLIRNFARDIDDAYVKHIGVKAALGYNPRSTTEWKGTRPSTRMGAIALLREELIKAKKTKALIKKKKKEPEEIEPLTDMFIDILDGKLPLMVHVHKEDDIVTLINLAKEFGIKTVVNHGCDVHSRELWEKVKREGLNVIFGPIDSFSSKVELKNESWRNIKHIVDVRPRFSIMSDHPVVLQRNLYLQLRFFVRFGMSKEEAVSLLTGNSADILGLKDVGKIKTGFLSSFVVWNNDPFDLTAYPVKVIGEGKTVYEE
ncbi:MAG TPA: imidazolonepropionase [Thermoplasmatales archaeon]|nr:imidazolonepropionase [Thermoplasmatales archaeon]